jgi:hypothetical protein
VKIKGDEKREDEKSEFLKNSDFWGDLMFVSWWVYELVGL